MKKILTLLFLALSFTVFSQVSNTKVVRIADGITAFGQPLSEGNILIDLGSDKIYLILKGITGTASLSSLTANVDYKEYQTGVTDHSALTNLSYATAGHTGFEPTVSKGNLTEATSSVLTITGGTASVIGSGTSIQVKQANTTQNGFLNSNDWNTFNNKQSTLTTGNLSETVNGLQFDATRQVIGGASTLSLTSGYIIPTTTEQTNWTAGYNDKINALAFSGTTTKTLTLTQQDGGTVSNTFTDLVNDADASLTNEGSLTVGAGTASTSLINSNTSGSSPVTLQAGTNVTLSESGNTITINSSATGGTPTIGVLYISGAGIINHLVTDTYYDINVFSTGAANNITATSSTFTVPSTGYYDIRFHISCTHATNNTVVHASLFVNNVENSEIEAERKIGTGGDYGNYSGGGIVSLNTGDIVKLKTKASNSGNQTISAANFSIKRIN